MIATVAPNQGSCEHTLNTLRYAYRVKELKKEPQSDASFNEEESVFHSFPSPLAAQKEDAAESGAFSTSDATAFPAEELVEDEPVSFIENENLLTEDESHVHSAPLARITSPVATPKKSASHSTLSPCESRSSLSLLCP